MEKNKQCTEKQANGSTGGAEPFAKRIKRNLLCKSYVRRLAGAGGVQRRHVEGDRSFYLFAPALRTTMWDYGAAARVVRSGAHCAFPVTTRNKRDQSPKNTVLYRLHPIFLRSLTPNKSCGGFDSTPPPSPHRRENAFVGNIQRKRFHSSTNPKSVAYDTRLSCTILWALTHTFKLRLISLS